MGVEPGRQIEVPTPAAALAVPLISSFSLGRLLAYTNREAMEILPRPRAACLPFRWSAIMMFVFGFGITTDVEDIKYASLDLDQTPESRSYRRSVRGSRYFLQRPPPFIRPIS